MYTYINTCMHACMHACINTYIIHTYIHTYMCICIYTYMYIYIYKYNRVYTYIYIYIYLCLLHMWNLHKYSQVISTLGRPCADWFQDSVSMTWSLERISLRNFQSNVTRQNCSLISWFPSAAFFAWGLACVMCLPHVFLYKLFPQEPLLSLDRYG